MYSQAHVEVGVTKSKPFTVRLSRDVEDWLETEARRTKLSKGALLESLADESIRTRRFPGIAFRGAEHDRRAWMVGTGFDVWEIVEAYQEIGREELLSTGTLSARQLDLALAYHARHPREIDEAIRENRQPIEHWRERYPGLPLADARE